MSLLMKIFKNIKMKFLVYLFLICFSFSLSAQENDDEKIKALKVAFFTKELDLSEKEAQKFWPVYNKHNKIYEDLRGNEWAGVKARMDEINSLCDEDANKLLKDYQDYQTKRLAIRLDYIQDLEKVISAKKIMLLRKAEYEFNKNLLKQYRQNEAKK